MHELSQQVVRIGRAEPPPRVWPLRAGPIRLLCSDGDLRQIRHGDVGVARGIYVAIRDLAWNTLSGTISDLDVTDRGDSFAIRFTRRHTVGALDYQWRAEIDGLADGTVRYRMGGEAMSAFPYAKIGICVHHPIDGFAGQQYRGSTPDGPVKGNLPDAIGPQIHLADGTDLPLFEPVSDLDISHASGGTVRFEFGGDLWEMEDQRNWTDASYKSASTPARLGYDHEAGAGKQFDQQVVIRAAGFPAPTDPGQAADDSLTVTPGAATGKVVPPIGLRCANPGTEPSAAGLAALRALAPAHLRVDVHLRAESAELELAAAADRARELNCGLELAAFLPGQDADVGGRVRLICGSAPTTVNLHDVMFGVRRGRVVEIWPVFPRGPQHGGFLGAFDVIQAESGAPTPCQAEPASHNLSK